jgi:hypothetical protein
MTVMFMILAARKKIMRLFVVCAGLAFGLSHGSVAVGALAPNAPSSNGSITAQFAFADFDGDRHPDLAILRREQFSGLKTRYSLTFSLSTGNRKSIGLTGPSGGLLLFPRDVNGDNALDLVVTAKWPHETVAVFLNDGSGSFTPTDPAMFPVDIAQSDTVITSARLPLECGAVLLGTQRFFGHLAESSSVHDLRQVPGAVLFGTSIVASHFAGSAFSGRAPPSFNHAS